MVNVITQLFKYMVALIMAIYTIRCFTVFSVKKEKKKRRIYRSQNLIVVLLVRGTSLSLSRGRVMGMILLKPPLKMGL